MKMFWKILSTLYSHLVVDGLITSKPPAFLFHQPTITLPCQMQEIILVDKSFSENEQKLIIEAVDNLEQFSNGLIRIILKFDLEPDDEERIDNHHVILRVASSDTIIASADEQFDSNILGLCQVMDNDTRKLYLVHDRINNDIVFRTTALHELGHFIGLDHTQRPSIMFRQISPRVLYMTYKDAVEMAKVWQMLPSDFRYFYY